MSTAASASNTRLQRVARGQQRRERRQPEQVLGREHRCQRDEDAEGREQRERAVGVHAARRARATSSAPASAASANSRPSQRAVVPVRFWLPWSKAVPACAPEAARDVGQHRRPRLDLGIAAGVVADPREPGLAAPEGVDDLGDDRNRRRGGQEAHGRPAARERGRGRQRDELERPGKPEPGPRAARAACAVRPPCRIAIPATRSKRVSASRPSTSTVTL